jgi:hypothetical protein
MIRLWIHRSTPLAVVIRSHTLIARISFQSIPGLVLGLVWFGLSCLDHSNRLKERRPVFSFFCPLGFGHATGAQTMSSSVGDPPATFYLRASLLKNWSDDDDDEDDVDTESLGWALGECVRAVAIVSLEDRAPVEPQQADQATAPSRRWPTPVHTQAASTTEAGVPPRYGALLGIAIGPCSVEPLRQRYPAEPAQTQTDTAPRAESGVTSPPGSAYVLGLLGSVCGRGRLGTDLPLIGCDLGPR